MKMNQKGKGRDDYETPKYLYNHLNEIFNFEFDAACTSENCLAPDGYFFDMGDNGLVKAWRLRTFCNPPFSEKELWINKAADEVLYGDCPICVMLLPSNCMDTKAFHKAIDRRFFYEVLDGRIGFINPETGKPDNQNNSGTIVVYFMKKIPLRELKKNAKKTK